MSRRPCLGAGRRKREEGRKGKREIEMEGERSRNLLKQWSLREKV